MKKQARDFSSEAASWDNPGRVSLANDIAAAIQAEAAITPETRALDFGCGTGLLTLALQPAVRSIEGIDSAAGMLDVLREKIHVQGLPNVTAQHLNIEQGGVIQGAYDLIVSSMTMHHIQNIAPLLAQFYNVLSPGGQLCIVDLDLDGGLFHEDNTGVYHYGFDRTQMAQLFADAGFLTVQTRDAAERLRPVPGGSRRFTMFLTIGHK